VGLTGAAVRMGSMKGMCGSRWSRIAETVAGLVGIGMSWVVVRMEVLD
jgi:hypothetical protein